MIFSKIDYINLLPFHIYTKKNIRSSQVKAIINYKKSYPALINKKFNQHKTDAAFISSIASRNKKALDIGIVAKNEVTSVLAIKGNDEEDYESSSSNILAKVLGIKGKVIIGDKALKYYLEHDKEDFIDLAQVWKEKYNLPFVFARLCYNSHEKYLKKITKKFNKRNIKIPRYILSKYSKQTGIKEKDILQYLSKIDYEINMKEKKALKLFLKLAKGVNNGNY